MFRALNLFTPGTSTPPTIMMDAPVSVTLVEPEAANATPVALTIRPDAIFTTAVGHSSKRTLASWHVTTPQEIVDHMLEMVENHHSPRL